MLLLLALACLPQTAVSPPALDTGASGDVDADTDPDTEPDTDADTEPDSAPDGEPVPDTGTWPAPSTCAAAAWAWGADNTVETAETSFVGESVGDWAGAWLTNPGDMNGDGRDDLVIGAPFRTERASGAGKAYFIVGSGPRGRSQSLAGRPSVTGSIGSMEVAITFPLGDVDGDGLADVAVRPGYQNSAPPGGQYLVRGRASAWTSSLPTDQSDAATTNTDNTDGSTDVMSQGPFGDMDGDGLADWFMWTNAVHGGESYVVSGADASGALTLPGDAALWLTGAGAPAFGDLDGDGLTDIVDQASDNATLSFIYGSAAPPYDATVEGTAVASVTSPNGAWPDVLQDVSGDGLPELAVTASNDGLYLFVGGTRRSGASDLSAADVHIAAGETAWDPAWLGDINGDGIGDLGFMVNQDGASLTDVYVLFGRTTWPAEITLADADVHVARTADMRELLRTPEPDQVGDIDGDGIDDLLLRDPYEAANGVDRAGTTYLFRGRTSWSAELSVTAADATFSGSIANEALGEGYWLVVEDYDGDGCDDIVASSYYRPAPSGSTTGETFIFYGQH